MAGFLDDIIGNIDIEAVKEEPRQEPAQKQEPVVQDDIPDTHGDGTEKDIGNEIYGSEFYSRYGHR